MPHENLEISIDVALRMRKMCETARKICQEVLEQNKELNDGLEVLIAGLNNGISNIHVKLDDHLALLAERRAILGKEGFPKIIHVSIGEPKPEDEPLDPYD